MREQKGEKRGELEIVLEAGVRQGRGRDAYNSHHARLDTPAESTMIDEWRQGVVNQLDTIHGCTGTVFLGRKFCRHHKSRTHIRSIGDNALEENCN